MPAIVTRQLTKVYRTYKKKPGLAGAVRGLFRREYEETRAVDGVSFAIEEGEFVGFLGPNGAGKTTVLKMLSGLLNPSSGQAEVLGFVPWQRKDAMKRQISLLMGQKNASQAFYQPMQSMFQSTYGKKGIQAPQVNQPGSFAGTYGAK